MANNKKTNRSSNIELLRIISIVLILFYHLARNSAPVNTVDTVFLTALSSWGILGVNCFVAISGYFLLEQKFKLSRVAVVFFQTVTYSVVFLAVRLAYDFIYFDKPIISNLVSLEFAGLSAPFWVTRYWFVWTYLLLCIFAPFLNLLIEKLTRANHIKLLVCMSFILLYGTCGNGVGIVCDLSFFVYIYFAVAFIKKYPGGFFEKFGKTGSLIMALVLILAKNALPYLGSLGDMVSSTLFSTNRHSAYMVIMALFLFCAFKNMRMKQNKAVNFLALQSLGIYLFHENLLFLVSDHLYAKLDTELALPASFLILIGALILFIAGSSVEFVRRILCDKTVASWTSNSKTGKKIDEIMEL